MPKASELPGSASRLEVEASVIVAPAVTVPGCQLAVALPSEVRFTEPPLVMTTLSWTSIVALDVACA